MLRRAAAAAGWPQLATRSAPLVGAILGLAPHVIHHIGLIAGAALVTGAAGNGLFFGIGLVFSIPLLRRLYRRFRTWRAPATAMVVFAAVFSLSAFVVGPAVSGALVGARPPRSRVRPRTTLAITAEERQEFEKWLS